MKQLFHFCFAGFLSGLLLLTAAGCTSVKNTGVTVAAGKKGPAMDYIRALLRFEPWADSVWHNYAGLSHSGYFGDGRSSGNGGIRGNCGIALSYAVLVRALPEDPKRSERLKKIEEALHYAAETHQSGPDSVVAVDGKKWGVTAGSSLKDPKGWQSSMWAASMGFAAALVERDIAPGVVRECKRVVAAEADWLSKKAPASGYKHNTKAEENAWQSNIVSLAAAWMSADARAKKWLKTARLYLANTYTVPSDSSGPLKEWIRTQTLYPDYALENHGFYHPTYQMVAGMSLGDSYLMAQMIDPETAGKIAPFAKHNVVPVWRFMETLVLDSGELAYPSGLDWSLHDFEHISYFSWLAAYFRDPVAQWAEPRLAKQILYRQSVNGDGRFVGESCPDGFYREAVEARRVAMAYLQDAINGFPVPKGSAPENGIFHYPSVGLILQRSDNALTTVSYGPRTMSLVYPLKGKSPAQRFLISPNTETLMGSGSKALLKQFREDATGFRAVFLLQDKKGAKSRMVIDSRPDAVVYIKVPMDTPVVSSAKWLLTAVENAPLTGGVRTVFRRGDSVQVRGRSGVAIPPAASGWINIDNWMGFVTLPGGGLGYQAAAKYNRNGAAEDHIYYQPEDPDLPGAVIVLPGANAAMTSEVQKSVRWFHSASGYRLSFLSPDGAKRTVVTGG